jgi:23S rRNA pseudouridine2604 synthase
MQIVTEPEKKGEICVAGESLALGYYRNREETDKHFKIWQAGEKSFRIILTQGLNRQIRRMCETLGYRVMTLQRVRIMNIRLGSLKEGTWRNIEGEERKELDALLSDSSSLSVKERNEKQRERRGGI